MYCNQCGSVLPEGARFCPSCQGAVAYVRRPRVEGHLSLLSALWFAMAGLRVLATLIVFVIAAIFPMLIARAPQPPPFPVHLLLVGVGILTATSAVLTLITAWGLYTRARWGRMLALVMAFLGLLSMPFGTGLGIYTLYVLLSQEAATEWDGISAR